MGIQSNAISVFKILWEGDFLRVLDGFVRFIEKKSINCLSNFFNNGT